MVGMDIMAWSPMLWNVSRFLRLLAMRQQCHTDVFLFLFSQDSTLDPMIFLLAT